MPPPLEPTPLENEVVGWAMPTGPCSGTTWFPKESRCPAPNKHLCLLLPCEWLHKVQQPRHPRRKVTCAPVGWPAQLVHDSLTVGGGGQAWGTVTGRAPFQAQLGGDVCVPVAQVLGPQAPSQVQALAAAPHCHLGPLSHRGADV